MLDEEIYRADADLLRPGLFLRRTLARLRRAAPAGWTLFRSNLKVQGRRSALGYAWLILPTLAGAIVSFSVRSNGAVSLPAMAMPYPAFVLSGLAAWQIFVDAVNGPLKQLGSARNMLTRSGVPHETMLLASVCESLFNGALRTLILFPVLLLVGASPSATLALAPLALLILVVAGTAIGVALAPIGLLYDDILRGLPLALTLWLFLSPVVYPVRASGLLALNPARPLVDSYRNFLTGGGDASGFAVVALLAALLLVAGWLIYGLARPHLVERLG